MASEYFIEPIDLSKFTPIRGTSLEERCRKLTIIDVGLDMFGSRMKKQKNGPDYSGSCPFHPGKTHSFSLDSRNNTAMCFEDKRIISHLELPLLTAFTAAYLRKWTTNLPSPIIVSLDLAKELSPFDETINVLEYLEHKIGLRYKNIKDMSLFARILEEGYKRVGMADKGFSRYMLSWLKDPRRSLGGPNLNL